MTETKNSPGILSSVRNALQILQCYNMNQTELSVSELSVSLGLGKSTVSRLMSTLASEGFVIKNPENQKYRLGLTMLTLGGIVTSNLEINTEAAPVVHQIVNELGETAHLTILDGIDTIYIHKEDCTHPIRILTYIGRRNPAHCTSSGKVLLAHSDESIIKQAIESGLKHPEYPINDPDQFLATLQETRDNGYNISINEITDGVTSIAAPIRDYSGNVCSAITVVGPNQRIQQQKLPFFIKKVVEAGKEASLRLGYLGDGADF